MPYSGAEFFIGKGNKLSSMEATIKGVVIAAKCIKSIAKVYGIPVIINTDHTPRNY